MSTSTPGEDAAFAELFGRSSPRVYAYARRHLDATAAQDVVSEVFLAAWRRRDTLPDDPLPWLLVTARNVINNHLRSSTRQARLARHLAGVEQITQLSSATQVERVALVAAFAQLRLDDREALLLVGWDGLTPSQAAEVLGCTPNTFAARLHRARRRFEALLNPPATDEPNATPTLRLASEGDLR